MVCIVLERHFQRQGETVKAFGQRITTNAEIGFARLVDRVAMLGLENALCRFNIGGLEAAKPIAIFLIALTAEW